MAGLSHYSNAVENVYAIRMLPISAEWGKGAQDRVLFFDSRPLLVRLTGRVGSTWFYDRAGQPQARVNMGVTPNVDGDERLHSPHEAEQDGSDIRISGSPNEDGTVSLPEQAPIPTGVDVNNQEQTADRAAAPAVRAAGHCLDVSSIEKDPKGEEELERSVLISISERGHSYELVAQTH